MTTEQQQPEERRMAMATQAICIDGVHFAPNERLDGLIIDDETGREFHIPWSRIEHAIYTGFASEVFFSLEEPPAKRWRRAAAWHSAQQKDPAAIAPVE